MLSGFTTRALSLLLGAGAVCQCSAEEKAPSSATEPARVKAFLGVMVSTLSPEVRAQLDIPPNEGLFVKKVSPGSPADSAGLRGSDILLQVKDQLLTSQEQFVSLIENFQPGDLVDVSWLHRGKVKRAEIMLEKREASLEPHPDEHHFNSLEWIEKMGNIIRTLRENPAAVEAVDRMLHGPDRLPLKPEKVFRMVCTDAGGSVEICECEGRKHLRVFDLENNLVFEGYFNTAEEKAALPPSLQLRVEKAEAASDELIRRRKQRELKESPLNSKKSAGSDHAQPDSAVRK